MNARLSRLENGTPVTDRREELVGLGTAEAYTFLINFLNVLLGLREYDSRSVQGIMRHATSSTRTATN